MTLTYLGGRPVILTVFAISVVATAKRATGTTNQHLHELLSAGKLAQAQRELSEDAAANPKDDVARYALGVVQFLRAVEVLGQDLYKHGMDAPFVRMVLMTPDFPIPQNPSPERINYLQFRAILEKWVNNLAEANKTLGELSPAEVPLPLKIGVIRLDLNGDRSGDESEALWNIFSRMTRGAQGLSPEQVEEFVLGLDRADAYWLQGYCHLLAGLAEFSLAHDFKESFERTAHLLFPKVETPYDFLKHPTADRNWVSPEFRHTIADAIAWIHLVNWQVAEPARMEKARQHLLSMIDRSRAMWKAAEAETDNENEWIPNPRQKSVLAGMQIDAEMVAGWHDFLNEAEALLLGEKLVPFWRGDGAKGVNLKRAFDEPRTFDLVLWIQGTAAQPYLEDGQLTTKETWVRLQGVFRGEFIGFALWLN